MQECPPKVEIPSDCGITNVKSTRITNGKPAPRGGFPWQVAVGYRNPNDDTIDYLCGAALVTKRLNPIFTLKQSIVYSRHVVTAAHCIRDDLETVLLGVTCIIFNWFSE